MLNVLIFVTLKYVMNQQRNVFILGCCRIDSVLRSAVLVNENYFTAFKEAIYSSN